MLTQIHVSGKETIRPNCCAHYYTLGDLLKINNYVLLYCINKDYTQQMKNKKINKLMVKTIEVLKKVKKDRAFYRKFKETVN